jgi:hypothetical protein
MRMRRPRHGWRLKQADKEGNTYVHLYKKAFGKKSTTGMSNREIVDVTGAKVNSVNRLFKGHVITSGDDIRKIFEFIVKDGEETVDDVINRYCDIITGDEVGQSSEKPIRSSARKNRLVCKTVWAKLIHLRDRYADPRPSPAYRRFDADRNEYVDVFDEFILMRTLVFDHKPNLPIAISGERHCDYALFQPIYPPSHRLVNPYASHREMQPEILWQGATNVINGFNRGSEWISAEAEEDCDRLVLVVDLSSIIVNNNEIFLRDNFPTAQLTAVTPYGCRRLLPKIDRPRLSAFSQHGAALAGRIHVGDGQAAQLADAHGGIEQKEEDGGIAFGVGRMPRGYQKRVDLLTRERLDLVLFVFRQFDGIER